MLVLRHPLLARTLGCRHTCCWRLPLPDINGGRLRHSASLVPHAASSPSTAPEPPPPPPPTVAWQSDAVNSVSLCGTVLNAPQLRHLPARQVAAQLRLGLRPRHSRPGVPWQPQGVVTVDAWGVLALQLAQHVHKGSRIVVRGALREDSWTDRATGMQRWMLKVVADEVAFLAPPGEHEKQQQEQQQQEQGEVEAERDHEQQQPQLQSMQQHHQEAQQKQQQQQEQQPTPYDPGPLPPAPPPPAPRLSSSAEQSLLMFQGGAGLDEIAAVRGIKFSTVVDHLLSAAALGGCDWAPASWTRLAAEVGLGPAGGPWLSPAEVAEAMAAVQLDLPAVGAGVELRQLPLRAIRELLIQPGRPAAPKVAALEAVRGGGGGDMALVYCCIKVVRTMLEGGVDFGTVAVPPVRASRAPAPPPF